jgi:hypothetical protein
MNGIKIKFDEFPSSVILSYYADFVHEDHRHICVFYVLNMYSTFKSERAGKLELHEKENGD